MPTRVDSRLQRSLHMANLLIGESVERAMSTATRRDFETDLLDAAGRVFAPISPPRIAEVQHDYYRTRLALVAHADEAARPRRPSPSFNRPGSGTSRSVGSTRLAGRCARELAGRHGDRHRARAGAACGPCGAGLARSAGRRRPRAAGEPGHATPSAFPAANRRPERLRTQAASYSERSGAVHLGLAGRTAQHAATGRAHSCPRALQDLFSSAGDVLELRLTVRAPPLPPVRDHTQLRSLPSNWLLTFVPLQGTFIACEAEVAYGRKQDADMGLLLLSAEQFQHIALGSEQSAPGPGCGWRARGPARRRGGRSGHNRGCWCRRRRRRPRRPRTRASRPSRTAP